MPRPWEKSYPPGVRWDVEPETAPLTRDLDRAAERWPAVPFLDFQGRPIDFRTFAALVERAARGFRALGVGRGVHVALFLPNVPHFPVAFYAVLRAGGVVVTLSPLDAAREVAQKLDKADVSVVVAFAGLADRLPKDRPGLRIVLAGPEDFAPRPSPPIPADPALPVPFAALLDPERERNEPWREAAADDLALLQFTGGTSGVPKAAMLTHANLSAAVSSYDHWSRAFDLQAGNERILAVLPLFHIFALTTLMLRGVRNGYTLLLKPRWDTDEVVEAFIRERPTLFSGVPTMYRALVAHPRAREIDFSALKYCGSGGAPLPTELFEAFGRLSGKPPYEGWGMTETAPAGTGTPVDARRPGSCGVPLPGVLVEVRDLGDVSRPLPAGEVGEICVRGRNVTRGYYRDPEETAAAFADGFFRTGDLGYLDADGYMFIVDRRKDMILSGGFNVYPRVIEEAMYEHPSVEEVIVVGVPDAYRGEAAKAFVKLRAGAAPFTLEELRAFLADRLGRHELPAQLEFRDALPKTAVGKLWKKPLADEERARAGGG